MATISCGIDFGTSNSSIALADSTNTELVPVEDKHLTTPSALFFTRKGNHPHIGREAIHRFLDRQPGRFMRSLKRVLGTPIMKQGTMVNGDMMRFDEIICTFLENLKTKADIQAQREVEHVVMGRPVHFVDNNPGADQQAEQELRQIAQRLGFKYIDFQYEPIAAAFAHEKNVEGEQLALVVDLGGGTSDFTVIRLSNEFINKTDRTSDILANTGVRIGGNDFDKDLSLASIMPVIGYRSTYGSKKLEVPLRHYHDLSDWSKVNFLYTIRVIAPLNPILFESHDKTKYQRLIKVLKDETGHTLLSATEDAKIGLTNQEAFEADLGFIEKGLSVSTSQKEFNQAIQANLDKIISAAEECLTQAAIQKDAIDLVILTGGSTEIPGIQSAFRNLFQNAKQADENKLSSVGLGLAFDSRNRFR
jgi:hypothetical chaperone protein